MTLSPEAVARILGVLFGALCIVVGSLAWWLAKRALSMMRAWVEFEKEQEAKAKALQAAIERVESLELELRGDDSDEHPGVLGRIRIAEHFARDATDRTKRLEADLGLSEPSMRELRVRRMREKMGFPTRAAAEIPYVEIIPDPPRELRRETPRFEEPRQLERFREERRAEERQSSHPPLSDLPPPAKTRPRHDTPYRTTHSTTAQPVVKRKPPPDDGEGNPPDSTGE